VELSAATGTSRAAAPGKPGPWPDIVLTVTVLLNTLAPVYAGIDPSSHALHIFPLLAGALLVLFARYTLAEKLLVVGLLLYTSVIVLANGAESIRLGVASAIFVGLLFATAKAYFPALWLSVLYVVNLLYIHTNGFTSVVWEQITASSSHNYFGEELALILMAAILSGVRGRPASSLGVAILVACALTTVFIPSRQAVLVLVFAAAYVLLVGGRALRATIVVFLAIAVVGYIYTAERIAGIDKLLGNALISPRTAILSCYLANLSIQDVLIGSDHTISGSCALAVLATVRYLHSGYLETIGQLGLLGVVLIIAYPVAVAYFAYRAKYGMVLALALAGLYQIAEAGFIWVYFMLLFVCVRAVFGLRNERREWNNA